MISEKFMDLHTSKVLFHMLVASCSISWSFADNNTTLQSYITTGWLVGWLDLNGALTQFRSYRDFKVKTIL